MRIGICCYPTFGGSGAVATELGSELAELGHEVHFISYARPARLAGFHPRVAFHRVHVSSYPLFRYPPYDLALASLMRDVAEAHRLEVLHVHYAIPHAVSAALACDMLEGRGPRVVTTLHGTDITIVGNERAYFHPIRYGIARSDAVTTVSEWLRGETDRIFSPGCAIDVIPNFVDVDRFRPCATTRLREILVPEGERVLSHVSNFRPVKRLGDVVEIFARTTQRVAAHLLLAGDGPAWGEAEARARELGVAERVHFLGEQEGVEEVLAASDVFLLPSEHESFGLSALEAMACGVPVVGTRAGGLPEVVDEGENGYLVEVGDVEAAADRVTRMLLDEPLRSRLGARARAAAADQFATQPVVARYVEIYERLLGGAA